MTRQCGDALGAGEAGAAADGGVLRWLLLAYLVLLPVQIDTPFDLRLAPSDLFLLAAAVAGLGVWRVGGAAWSPWHVALLALFILWPLGNLLQNGSISRYVLLNKMVGMAALFTSYVCLTSLSYTWGDVRRFLRVFAVAVVLQNALATAAFLWCRYGGGPNARLGFLLSDNYDRLSGMLVDPNAYGGLLAVAYAVLLLDGEGRAPLLSRWPRILGLLSLSAGLFLTSSRSAWIGFAALTLFGAVRNPRLLLLVVGMAAVGVVAVAYSAGEEGFDSMLEISGRQNTIEERVEINRNALHMFLDHPGFGAGLGAFAEEHDIIVHNTAMWFLAEFGAVGFVGFAGFISWFLLKGAAAYRRAGADERPLVAGLIAAHLAMMGLSMGVEALFQRWWWFVLALLGAANALAVRGAEQKAAARADEAPAAAPPAEQSSPLAAREGVS